MRDLGAIESSNIVNPPSSLRGTQLVHLEEEVFLLDHLCGMLHESNVVDASAMLSDKLRRTSIV